MNFPPYKVVALSTLSPYKNNARTHTQVQIDQIAASIAEFGWTNPILVDDNGIIIAGHGRLVAADQLGLEKVPVIEISELSDAQRKAYIIADNQLALNAGWDDELLKAELEELEALDFDISVIGFSDIDLVSITGEPLDFDADMEWEGMPEFNQEDKTSFRSVVVHFKDQGAIDDFCEETGQKITDKTKYLWYPEIEIERYADKVYINES